MPNPPVIYEINAWVWLNSLSRQYGHGLRLDSVPADEWDRLADLSVDTVWLMGVWRRSSLGRQISLSLPNLLEAYVQALPDFSGPADVCGSPYSIGDYIVDNFFGGPEALAEARAQLRSRGLRLILDFVPNHVAPDHPWIAAHPEYLIQMPANGTPDPAYFFTSGGRCFAYGRDPYFPAWTDTAQLNAFRPELRSAAAQLVRSIAAQCDGVRCDMAMLLLNDVFAGAWGDLAGAPPATEYWSDVISSVRAASPDFLFLGEAYWDLEYRLQQLGFDFCYDKRLRDRLFHNDANSVRAHLGAPAAYQEKLLRFLENHDESRVSAALSPSRHRAAAIAIATLPGGKLYYHGQFTGARIQSPVQLARQAAEPPDLPLEDFYWELLEQARQICLGEWQLLECSGWPDNRSHQNLLAWSWSHAEECWLIVINFSESSSQGHVHFAPPSFADLLFSDRLHRMEFCRSIAAIEPAGLFVSLDPWSSHVFRVTPAGK